MKLLNDLIVSSFVLRRKRQNKHRGSNFSCLWAGIIFCWCLMTHHAHAEPALLASTRYRLPELSSQARITLAAVDRTKVLAEDRQAAPHLPLRYAVTRSLNARLTKSQPSQGQWNQLPDGRWLWRLEIQVSNALSLDIGFSKFFLPHGAELFVVGKNEILGPYTDNNNPQQDELWLPLTHGDSVQLELSVPEKLREFVILEIKSINAGYRDILAPGGLSKSGTCQVDTICAEGNAWRDQINAEALITYAGYVCSSQLLNNTRQDRTPYLSTAHHCISTQAEASTVVAYWKYENPICRTVGSAGNGLAYSRSNAISQVGGATWLSSYEDSDVTLLRLNSSIPAQANPYWNGWDRRDLAPASTAVIHHADGNEKRISLDNNPPVLDNTDLQPELPGLYHWHVLNYEKGSTETGSSGAGLLDPNGRLIGLLTGGAAACGNNQDDYYGRFAPAWEGGGTTSSRLKEWLDPDNTKANVLDGLGSCVAPTLTLDIPASPIMAGSQINFIASAKNGVAPYLYEWDIENDGKVDVRGEQSSITTRFPVPFTGNLSVKVTDKAGCSNTISHALNVVGSDATVTFPPLTVKQPHQVCGNNDDQIDPGERWQFPVLFSNLNKIDISKETAVAIFSIAQGADQADASIEFPALHLPNATGDSMLLSIDVLTSPTSACGAPLTINYHGIISDIGYTSKPTSFSPANIGRVGCKPSNCTSSNFGFTPAEGIYHDPAQPGNGLTVAVGAKDDPQPVFLGAWFTGDANRNPIWYVVNDRLIGRQVNTSLYKMHYSGTFPAEPVPVGSAQISMIGPDKFAFTWTLGSKTGGSIFAPVVDSPSQFRAWHNPMERGWLLFDQFYPLVDSLMFHLSYLYDEAGEPRWVVAQKFNYSYTDGQSLQTLWLHPPCPNCAWLEYLSSLQGVGNLNYIQPLPKDDPRVNVSISLPSPFGTWNRTNFPLVPLMETKNPSHNE